MIGQAWPRPGRPVCHRMFSPDSTFHVTGTGSSETPLACGPRNWGQFTVEAASALGVSNSQRQPGTTPNHIFRFLVLIWIKLIPKPFRPQMDPDVQTSNTQVCHKIV